MPKLLAINNYYYYRGGAETVFLEHARMLEASGWSVVPFAMHHPRNLPSKWSSFFVEEIEFGTEYSLVGKLRRVPKVIYSREARRKLAGLLSMERPDICHAHNIYHHISPSILGLLRDEGVPTVMTLHDLKIACPAYQMLSNGRICERCRGGRIYNVVAHRCIKGSLGLSLIAMAESAVHRVLRSYETSVQRFLVPSRFYAAKFAEWGFAADRFRYVPNFVDTERLRPRLDPGDYVVYFGRLSSEKGLATLIDAAARARVKVVIAGSGHEAEPLRALATNSDAPVTFVGHLTGLALVETVQNSRAVVLPSEWYENAPMSILEAYALGKPVIGARIGGIPELIRGGETGLLFESGNAAALADALAHVHRARDAQLMAMGSAGRSWVESDFTVGSHLRRVLEIYGELGISRS